MLGMLIVLLGSLFVAYLAVTRFDLSLLMGLVIYIIVAVIFLYIKGMIERDDRHN